MSINLNDTTPAAPSGNTNLKWQTDSSGNVSAYVPTAGASGSSGSGGDLTAKYLIGSADAALPNAAVWPALYSGVDIPPVAAGSLDDEFDSASFNTARWAWINQQNCTLTQSGSRLHIEVRGGSNDQVCGIFQPTPAAPWEVTAQFAGVAFNNNSTNWGIALYESSSGKLRTWGPTQGNTGRHVEVYGWSSPTSYSGFNQGFDYAGDQLRYFRVTNNGSTLVYSTSVDGLTWFAYYSESLTSGFTAGPDHVGLYIDPLGTNVTLSCDWFRRTA